MYAEHLETDGAKMNDLVAVIPYDLEEFFLVNHLIVLGPFLSFLFRSFSSSKYRALLMPKHVHFPSYL